MQNNRLHARLDCKETCQLQWNGSSYAAIVKNLSITSMDVRFDSLFPDVIIGDKCVVYLFDDQNPHPYEYDCQVIRVDTPDIVLSIIDMHRHT
jgi:hypothetical protein